MRIRLVALILGLSLLGLGTHWQWAVANSLTETGNSTPTQTATAPLSHLTPEATLFYQDGGPFFTYPLMCPKNITLREGLSWRGITVGKSNLSDIEELYGVQSSRVEPSFVGAFADIYGIILTSKASIERKLARSFQTCVINWKIAALAIDITNDGELSDRIESWVSLFGEPEIISWAVGVGESWRYRTLMWPKRGLAIYVDRGDQSPLGAWVSTVIFLPPAHGSADLTKWPYSQLQTTPRISLQGEYPGPLNPFDFTGMLATATEQVGQTPMIVASPIFTSTPVN